MEFENLKENIREVLNKYLDNIEEVQLENNEYEDEDGNQATCDGYFAIATLLQRGFNEALQQVYNFIPEDYWDEEEKCECHHEHCHCGEDHNCDCSEHDDCHCEDDCHCHDGDCHCHDDDCYNKH